MQMAGVSTADADAYVAANGTLSGDMESNLRRIIQEKYVASYGVVLEPWTDFRRTGYQVLNPVATGVVSGIPRSLLLPQSEIDLNPNAPKQKASVLERIFWDK
jgi:hypothetical protein